MAGITKYINKNENNIDKILTTDSMKKLVLESESLANEEFLVNRLGISRDTYLVDKNDYMFHIVVEDKPVITNPESDKRKTNYRQLYYNLRDKEIYISLNNRVLTNNRNSLDKFLTAGVLPQLETETNPGMYAYMINLLGVIPNSYESRHEGRALMRLMQEYNKLEIVYKAYPQLCKLADTSRRGGRGWSWGHEDICRLLLSKIKYTDKTKPKDIFGASKAMLRRAEEQISNFYETFGEEASPESSLWKTILDNNRDVELHYRVIQTLDSIKAEGITTEEIHLATHSDRAIYNLTNILRETERDFKTDFKALIRYLYYDCTQRQGMEPDEASSQLRDYYRLVTHLPRFEKYPKYLKTAHDVASKNARLIKDELMALGIKKTYTVNKSLEMGVGSYVYLLPRASSELEEEGAMQANCVAGYARSVSIGKTIVVFMRDAKKMDESYITIEIQDHAIVQALRSHNRQMDYEDFLAMREWANLNKLSINVYRGFEDTAKQLNVTSSKKPKEVVREDIETGEEVA